jgi:hypothetical protein
VVLLQSGDAETLRLWRILVAESVRYFDEVYAKLGVLLTDEDIVGESFYNPMLPAVVADLDALGLLVESDGARCVFPPGFTNRNGDPLPLIVQKSDGGYGYAATDLAAVRDRVTRVGASRILYVVGAPQAQHLEMVFATAAMAGWLPDTVQRRPCGLRQRPWRRPENVQDARRREHPAGRPHRRGGRARRCVRGREEPRPRSRSPGRRWPRCSGSGPSSTPTSPPTGPVTIVFDWERMLAFEGNTAPYLQYAHARIRSIFRRGNLEVPDPDLPPVLVEPAERALALALLGFAEAVTSTLSAWNPSRLCAYLFDLATTFTGFYENCPVLKAPSDELRQSRLAPLRPDGPGPGPGSRTFSGSSPPTGCSGRAAAGPPTGMPLNRVCRLPGDAAGGGQPGDAPDGRELEQPGDDPGPRRRWRRRRLHPFDQGGHHAVTARHHGHLGNGPGTAMDAGNTPRVLAERASGPPPHHDGVVGQGFDTDHGVDVVQPARIATALASDDGGRSVANDPGVDPSAP